MLSYIVFFWRGSCVRQALKANVLMFIVNFFFENIELFLMNNYIYWIIKQIDPYRYY